jgi:tetratricopeptide (TPR) repeat protein
VTKNNDVAHTNIGMLLTDRGELDEALSHLSTALDIRSSSAHRHYDLSLALIHGDIGNVLARKGQLDAAIGHLRDAIAFQPDYADAHYNLGTVFFQQGRIDDAIAEWQTALHLRADDAGVHISLGNAFVQKGLLRGAIAHYERALELDPGAVLALNNLAWLLATSPDPPLRNGVKALECARSANQLSTDKNPVFVRTLAAALAENGQYTDAAQTASRASELARTQGEAAFANQLEQEADLYRRGSPLRDTSLTNGH